MHPETQRKPVDPLPSALGRRNNDPTNNWPTMGTSGSDLRRTRIRQSLARGKSWTRDGADVSRPGSTVDLSLQKKKVNSWLASEPEKRQGGTHEMLKVEDQDPELLTRCPPFVSTIL